MRVECKRVKHGFLSRLNPANNISISGGDILGDVGSKLFNSSELSKILADRYGREFANNTNIETSGQTVIFTRLPAFNTSDGKLSGGTSYDTSKHKKFIRFLKRHYEVVNVLDSK